ncbi:MAG TPA: CoA transferase [Acidimicrobiia bacterium]|nr:CoA transferase [Acidimicrobiia bacterium]
MDALTGLRVVDLSRGIAGAYAARLLADVGAEVTIVEPPGGDPLRRRLPPGVRSEGRDGALFRFLRAGMRSVVGAAALPPAAALLEQADLVLDSGEAGLDVDAYRARRPDAVVVSITPWGRTGPWADRPAAELVVQAEAGAVAVHGRPDEVPYQTGGRLLEWCTGAFAAVGALSALAGVRRSGRGELVDCSLLASAAFASVAFVDARHEILGRPALPGPARIVDAPSIEPTADGWVGITTNTRAHYEAFLGLIGRSDLLADDRWARAEHRIAHYEEWNSFVHPWTRRHSTAEVVAAAAVAGVPAVPVNDAAGVLAFPQFQARAAFEPAADGDFLAPRPPWRFDGVALSRRGPAPALDESSTTAPAGGAGRRPVAATSAAPSRPLAGLRVVDATAFWAGPAAGQVLAYLGAEVVHVEAVQRLDGSRAIVGPLVGAERWWERSAMFLSSNRDKLGLTLSLTSPEGRALFEQLLASADVLLENFAPRVFDRFGLTAERATELNPRLVSVRMPAFGLSGPARDTLGFAQTMEQVTGLAWMTGPAGGEPRNPRGPCDPLAGYQAAFAVLTALARRERTGRGGTVEVAMAEAALDVAAELIVNHTAYGAGGARDGNRDPFAAPQGVYRCRGTEAWLALSVTDDDQWPALAATLGSPAWADDPELKSAEGRRAAHDRLDVDIGRWAAGLTVDEAVATLVAAGVPAGAVRDPRLLPHHPQLRAIGYYEETDHPVCGRLQLPTVPFRFAGIERWAHNAAPLLGQHNTEVLTGILGLDPAAVARLEAEQVIGTVPV